MKCDNYKILTMIDGEEMLNNLTYTDYYYKLMLKARSLFKWNNLPNGIDEKWIEKFLYYDGNCCFFKDKDKGFMVGKIETIGKLNYYDEPTKIKVMLNNYISEELENNINCVIIRNNEDMIPTQPTTKLFSYRLANIERTIDTNIENQKYPLFIRSGEKQKQSFLQAMKQKTKNKFLIFTDKDFDIKAFESIKTDIPIVFDKLQIQKTNIKNEYLSFLGINNADITKRERLISNEVDANNEEIQVNEDVMLETRKKACTLINKMFKLNISVERRNNLDNDINVGDNDD